MMKLYYSPGSSSQCVHIALMEANMEFELVNVNLAPPRTTEHNEDYLTINERGYVPALKLDSGEILTEESAILQYIADISPNSKLIAPVGTIERFKTTEWLGYTATELQKWFLPIWMKFPDTVVV